MKRLLEMISMPKKDISTIDDPPLLRSINNILPVDKKKYDDSYEALNRYRGFLRFHISCPSHLLYLQGRNKYLGFYI